jgi:hypothetical protein
MPPSTHPHSIREGHGWNQRGIREARKEGRGKKLKFLHNLLDRIRMMKLDSFYEYGF